MAENGRGLRNAVNGLHFYAGLEIGYNMGGFNLSSPQTTELRVSGEEGGGAAESTLMKWVHFASSKVLLITFLVGLVTGNWFSFLGGAVATVDMQGCYWYAKRCGRKRKGGGVGVSSKQGDTFSTGEDVATSLRASLTDLPTSGGAPLRTR